MAKTVHTPEWLKFLKPGTDFFALLNEQAQTTLSGAKSFKTWLSAGAEGECDGVHKAEHEADEQKLNIQKKLADTIVTPFDREEIYDISVRLDSIINAIKKIVKDIEFIEAREIDEFMQKMSAVIQEGMEAVVASISFLEHDLAKAQESARVARKTETQLAKVMREATKNMFEDDKVARALIRKQEYDSLYVVAQQIESFGEKLLHISIKMD